MLTRRDDRRERDGDDRPRRREGGFDRGDRGDRGPRRPRDNEAGEGA